MDNLDEMLNQIDVLNSINDEEMEELTNELENATPVEEKTVDYSVESDGSILFVSESLVRVLNQLNTVIDLNAPRVVSRGLNLQVGDGCIHLITPNELYYFDAKLDSTNTLPVGTNIYLDFKFLVKMIRFLPNKVLIYLKGNKYYIRLLTGDLELINTQLMDLDLKRLVPDYEVTDELLMKVNKEEILNNLNTFSKLYTFEDMLPRRVFDVSKDGTLFISPNLYGYTKLTLPEVRLYPKTVNYLIKAANLCTKDGYIEVYKTTSDPIVRYAIVYDNITMVTNYPDAKVDETLLTLLTTLPMGTGIDFTGLKYLLDYVNCITYAKGTISLVNENDTFKGIIDLENDGKSEIDIPILGNNYLIDQTFKVNAKLLLQALNTLDPSLNTFIGYKDGMLYLWNTRVTLILMTQ